MALSTGRQYELLVYPRSGTVLHQVLRASGADRILSGSFANVALAKSTLRYVVGALVVRAVDHVFPMGFWLPLALDWLAHYDCLAFLAPDQNGRCALASPL